MKIIHTPDSTPPRSLSQTPNLPQDDDGPEISPFQPYEPTAAGAAAAAVQDSDGEAETPPPPPEDNIHQGSRSSDHTHCPCNTHTHTTTSPSTLTTLPAELHLQISTNLLYPDILALKHTSRHFYTTIPTNVPLRVEWLIDRHIRGLACPMQDGRNGSGVGGKCVLRTDASFVNGSGGQVRRLMASRRRHEECREGVLGGCEVFGGRGMCTGAVVGDTCGGMSSGGFGRFGLRRWKRRAGGHGGRLERLCGSAFCEVLDVGSGMSMMGMGMGARFGRRRWVKRWLGGLIVMWILCKLLF